MTTIKHKTLANRILSVTRKVSPGASLLRVVLRSLPLCQAAASVVSPATPPTERKSTTAPWPCRGHVRGWRQRSQFNICLDSNRF